jgi:hypothetical protein
MLKLVWFVKGSSDQERRQLVKGNTAQECRKLSKGNLHPVKRNYAQVRVVYEGKQRSSM